MALCFVAVLGLMLAGYLALCSRVMNLSNRGFQRDLGRQLAEAGIEEALRAFNKNDWSDWSGSNMSVDWSLDTTNKRATATISFSSGKFAQGTTAEIKVRVDNYDAQVLGASWSSSKDYVVGDVVGYGGMWYRCITPHNNQEPTATGNLAYWVPAPIPWQWSENITYYQNDVVNYDGIWYRCGPSSLAATTTVPSPTNTNWVTIPANVRTWDSATTYYEYDIVNHDGRNYRCLSTNTNQSPPHASYWSEAVKSVSLSWESDTVYTIGAVVFNDGSWYSCISNHESSSAFSDDVAYWHSPDWSSAKTYSTGDLVYQNGTWYTCRTSHTNQTPPNGTYWFSAYYSSGTTYSSGHVIYYTDTTTGVGKWYRYIYATPASNRTPSSYVGSYWEDISTYSSWSSVTPYTVGDRVKYNGAWYSCNTAHTNQSPPNSSYWTASNYVSWQYLVRAYQFNDVSYYSSSGSGTWYRRDVNSTTVAVPTNTSYWENALSDSWDWNSGDDYNIGDVVYLSGSFYRCIRAHTTSQTPPNSTYWSTEPPFSTYWDANKNYTANDVVRYRGSWYRNLTGSNTRPGTDDDNWAIAPGAVTPWSTSKTYHVDDVVSSSGNWYRCKRDHSNQAVGSDNTYWVQLAGPVYAWSASTAYAANSYVSYGGVWYKCIAATTANAGHSPNHTTYWTPTWPQSAGVTTGAPVVYAESEVTLGDNTTSRAQLRATLDPASLFPNAAGATTTLTIGSGAGTVDSYDSELTDSSDTNGDNYVAANAGYSAVLAAGTGSSSGTSTLLSVGGSTAVQGYAAATPSSTAPYAPRASYGSSATVHGATSSVSPNIDTAQVSRSPYIPQFDIQTPIQQTSIPTSLPSTTYSLNLGTPGAPTPSVYYYSGSINIQANETININGPVILRINGYLLANTGTFKVTSTGSVIVYLPYVIRSYSGAGGFQNLTKDPKKMLFINTSTTSPSTATYFVAPSGSPEFYGAIYMPNVTATLGLDIRTGNEIFGALSAREITFSTEANLHYDTSLRYATFSGVDQPYTVTAWSELAATEQATMP